MPPATRRRTAATTTTTRWSGDIHSVAAAHPNIVKLFSIGKSYKGRNLWAAKVSDHVNVDENEPEVMLDGLHHSREHLAGEQMISLFDLLTGKYGSTHRSESASRGTSTAARSTSSSWSIPTASSTT